MSSTQSETGSSLRTQCTIYCFRAHRVTPLLLQNYQLFVDAFGADKVYLLADATTKDVDWPSYMQVLRLTSEFLDDNNLHHSFGKVGWRCGDYFYYLALANIQFDRLWLIETDVYFDYPSLADFFNPFACNDADFISHRVRRREAEWHWHDSMASLGYREVYGSLFPLTRISRAALTFLLDERRYISARFDSGRANGALYPNDEAFTASVLANTQYRMESLSETHPKAFELYQYTDKYRLPDAILGSRSPKVIHSALSEEEYLEYVEARILKNLAGANSLKRAIKAVFKEADSSAHPDIKATILRAVDQYVEKNKA